MSSTSGEILTFEEDYFGCELSALPVFSNIEESQDTIAQVRLSGTFMVHEICQDEVS